MAGTRLLEAGKLRNGGARSPAGEATGSCGGTTVVDDGARDLDLDKQENERRRRKGAAAVLDKCLKILFGYYNMSSIF
jgi:hypothetical protein